MKAYTDIEQSKKLIKILSDKSADGYWHKGFPPQPYMVYTNGTANLGEHIPCWSLAALLNILHSKTKNISSLSGGGYKDGKYTLDWCLDYEFDDGDYQKTFADNPVDACVAMIEKLHELNLL